MSIMYAVVCFVEENSLSVVPRSWLHRSGQDVMCRWPNLKSKALSKAIEEGRPADSNWPEFAVKVLVETGELC